MSENVRKVKRKAKATRVTEQGQEGVLVTNEHSENELAGITALLQGVVTPFTKAQEVSEQESTKRANILAGIANKIIYALFGILSLVLLLAGYAINHGNDALAEKIVIALIAFLGGLGAGKVSGK